MPASGITAASDVPKRGGSLIDWRRTFIPTTMAAGYQLDISAISCGLVVEVDEISPDTVGELHCRQFGVGSGHPSLAVKVALVSFVLLGVIVRVTEYIVVIDIEHVTLT